MKRIKCFARFRKFHITINILGTFSVIFLVLLIHLLVLFIIYVGLSVLLVLLERQKKVYSDRLAEVMRRCAPRGTAEPRRSGAEMTALPFRWWQHLCRSPSPPPASSLSDPDENKCRKIRKRHLEQKKCSWWCTETCPGCCYLPFYLMA